jgi:hypothetical protein
MTREQRIEQLKAQRKAVGDKLNDRIAEGAPDSEKEKLADEFNGLSEELTKLGHSDA